MRGLRWGIALVLVALLAAGGVLVWAELERSPAGHGHTARHGRSGPGGSTTSAPAAPATPEATSTTDPLAPSGTGSGSGATAEDGSAGPGTSGPATAAGDSGSSGGAGDSGGVDAGSMPPVAATGADLCAQYQPVFALSADLPTLDTVQNGGQIPFQVVDQSAGPWFCDIGAQTTVYRLDKYGGDIFACSGALSCTATAPSLSEGYLYAADVEIAGVTYTTDELKITVYGPPVG